MPFFSSVLLHIHTHRGPAQYILAYEKHHCISYWGLGALLKGTLVLSVEGEGGHAQYSTAGKLVGDSPQG